VIFLLAVIFLVKILKAQRSSSVKRQILGSDVKSDSKSLLSVSPESSPSLTKSQMQKLLRQKRSLAYLEALQQLDAGGHQANTEALNGLISSIESELPDISNQLLGIVSKCYLGHPFEVHTLQIDGDIIHHYKAGNPLPAPLEKARGLALHSSYLCIEVYTHFIVAISKNGSASLIEGEGS
jgi:hypothetical protein